MNIELKEWQREFAGDLAQKANDQRIAENLRDGFPHPYSFSDAVEFIENCIEKEGGAQLLRAVFVDGELAGGVGLFLCADVYRFNAELGYWLAPPFWNRGVMTEAVRRMCEIGFSTWNIVRIFAEPFGFNQASVRVLEKVGFVREGVLKKGIFKNGKFADYYIYALLKE